jgi:alkyl hydroperoxide reductase subunit AhpC
MDSMEINDMDYAYSAPLVGNPAPEFAGTAYLKAWESGDNPLGTKEISLSDFKGKWLVFFFHPLAFTPPCESEISAFNAMKEEFAARGAEILGCSIDSHFTQKAWIDSGSMGEVNFPLFSDLDHTVGLDYGVLTEKGFSLRGLFLIDPNGVIQYSVTHMPGIGRSTEETLRVLDALQSGGVCPANWHKGDKTLG